MKSLIKKCCSDSIDACQQTLNRTTHTHVHMHIHTQHTYTHKHIYARLYLQSANIQACLVVA